MRIFSLFLSSLLLCVAPLSAQTGTPAGRQSFAIEMGKGYISGILITAADDSEIRGSMVNEFGVSALDFICDRANGKVELVNVVGFLNKWYIKRVLKPDLSYCMHILYGSSPGKVNRKAYDLNRDGDTVSITNLRREIKYTFSPLPQPTPNPDDEEDNDSEQ